MSFVVRVDDLRRRGSRGDAPLVGGMLCEVELCGRTQPARVVVPRSAVRDGHVQLLDADSRLRRRAVEVAYTQADFAVSESGLEAGETVVVSDPTPAIQGLLASTVLVLVVVPCLYAVLGDLDLLAPVERPNPGPEESAPAEDPPAPPAAETVAEEEVTPPHSDADKAPGPPLEPLEETES